MLAIPKLPFDRACDSHIHVYGPRDRYPIENEARYAWYDSPVSAHQRFASRVGIGRTVIVQPSIYGTDNRCTLDAAESLRGAGRAVVEIDEASVTDAELDEMHLKGARGVRLTIALAGAPDEAMYEKAAERIQSTASRIARKSWHIEVMAPGWLCVRLLPVLRKTGLNYCLGHVAGLRPDAGSTPGDLEAILDELSREPRGYVKLSASYRLTSDPAYGDLVPIVQQLVRTVPTRLLWGTDFPHPKHADRVTPDQQLEMLLRCVTDADTLEHILVRNPEMFYEFL